MEINMLPIRVIVPEGKLIIVEKRTMFASCI